MPRVALVLSGGGAKGAFQAGAERYARQVKGYDWDIIAGVSVGALNGGMLAMQKYQELWDLWSTISNDQVYTGRMTLWYAALRVILGRRAVLGNRPLQELIEREFDPGLVKTDLRIGAVSLVTGQYVQFRPGDPNFTDAVLASTAMPIFWAPVEVEPHGQMVDGGVRNITPLGDVLDDDPDEVIIIKSSPQDPETLEEPPSNIFDIGVRSLEIAVNEIFVSDVREFLRINHNVKEAEAHGVTLHDEDGKPYKYFDYKLIQPNAPLGDSIDFSQETVQASMRAGWATAEAVLGPPPSGPAPFPELPGEE
jgi:NTE family protein